MLAFDQQNNKVNFWREDEDHGVHFGLYTVETNGDVTMEVGDKPAVHITMHPSGFTAWRSGNSKGTMNCVYADDTDIQPVRWYDPSPPVAAPERAPTFADAPAPTAPTYVAPSPVTSAGNDDTVPITMIHNSIHVVVTVGGRPLDMVLDTGANVSSIPPSLANNLIAAGRAEEGPSVPITLANGATENERTVFVDSLVIGRYARSKVLVSVSDGDPLLGLPILNAIGKFSIDAERGVLSFEGAVSASE